jgi:hypothetical protein
VFCVLNSRAAAELKLHSAAGGTERGALVFQTAQALVVLTNVLLIILGTIPRFRDEESFREGFHALLVATLVLFCLEYVARLWSCVLDPRFRWFFSHTTVAARLASARLGKSASTRGGGGLLTSSRSMLASALDPSLTLSPSSSLLRRGDSDLAVLLQDSALSPNVRSLNATPQQGAFPSPLSFSLASSELGVGPSEMHRAMAAANSGLLARTVLGRARWAVRPMSLLDLLVIACFTVAVLAESFSVKGALSSLVAMFCLTSLLRLERAAAGLKRVAQVVRKKQRELVSLRVVTVFSALIQFCVCWSSGGVRVRELRAAAAVRGARVRNRVAGPAGQVRQHGRRTVVVLGRTHHGSIRRPLSGVHGRQVPLGRGGLCRLRRRFASFCLVSFGVLVGFHLRCLCV